MVKIYVNNYGWILGRDKKGKLHYTKFKEGAKEFPNEYDKEFESYAGWTNKRKGRRQQNGEDRKRCLLRHSA